MTSNYDYNIEGRGYSDQRQSDPIIEKQIHAALGSAQKILNVGAGTGSYEPTDREVVAVEPSSTMRDQRPKHLTPAIDALAESLPFEDKLFDASMAILTVHHWKDPSAGLLEMCRVTKGSVVVVTFDVDAPTEFWLKDYVPEAYDVDKYRFPKIDRITELLGGSCQIEPINIPRDCKDGVGSGLYARPEKLLDGSIRKAQSMWRHLPEGVEDSFVAKLSRDLESGQWDERYGHFRSKPFLEGQMRLISKSLNCC